ncbi:MAG: biotin--[acetyl-CoA-carboxylase] ligase [Bacteroidota bacterium]
MSAFPAGYSFNPLAQVNSTNMHAMELVYAGLAGNGAVFFTNYQTQGKGQRGKEWVSAPGESVLMTIVLDTSRLTTSQAFRLSATVAVAVKNFIEFISGSAITIKWPNDLYSGDRKAGGILIENILNQGSLKWSIIGIGLNANQTGFSTDLPQAVSLSMLTGKTYDCELLAKQLTGFVDAQWQQLLDGNWERILATYNENLYGRGSVKRLKKGAVTIPCKIQKVDNHGMLVAGENEEWHFSHGEVEWLQSPTK